jgi:hypothetical protein
MTPPKHLFFLVKSQVLMLHMQWISWLCQWAWSWQSFALAKRSRRFTWDRWVFVAVEWDILQDVASWSTNWGFSWTPPILAHRRITTMLQPPVPGKTMEFRLTFGQSTFHHQD